MPEDRRTILKLLSGVLGGGCAAAVGGPILGAALAPALKITVRGAEDFVPIFEEAGLPDDGVPVAVPVVVEAPQDAWSKLPPTQVGAVYLLRDPDQKKIIAYTTVCPHLGCRVDYHAADHKFICPCHDSEFGIDGAVRSGPAPRGLDQLETKTKDGQIYVRFSRFKTGTDEKIEV